MMAANGTVSCFPTESACRSWSIQLAAKAAAAAAERQQAAADREALEASVAAAVAAEAAAMADRRHRSHAGAAFLDRQIEAKRHLAAEEQQHDYQVRNQAFVHAIT